MCLSFELIPAWNPKRAERQEVLKNVAFLVLVLLVVVCQSRFSTAVAQGIESKKKQGAAAPFEAEKVIESLVSKNVEPKLVGDIDEREPIFEQRFNWSEQERVYKAINTLVEHAEVAWPYLIKHLDDKRYAITVNLRESAHNFSVGDVCETIISDSISQGYYIHLPAGAKRTGQAFAMMDAPPPLKERKLKAWCEQRSGQKLSELQIEMCKSALSRIPELTDASQKERLDSINAIKAQIKQLEQTKKPVKVERFFRSLKVTPFKSSP